MDINQIWRDINNESDDIQKMLIMQIPIIDQCELWKCSIRMQEIAHEESLAAIDYMQTELGSFLDTFIGPDDIDREDDDNFEEGVQANIVSGNAEGLEEV